MDTVDVPAGKRWMGRVDGVDILGGDARMGTGPTTLIAPNWTMKIPEGGGGIRHGGFLASNTLLLWRQGTPAIGR